MAVALGSVADVRSHIDSGTDLEARDSCHRTAWLLSIQTGDVDKAELLLAAGSGPASPRPLREDADPLRGSKMAARPC